MYTTFKYYACWGQGISKVCLRWSEVEDLRLKYPFIQWRKLPSEEAARQVLQRMGKGECYNNIHYLANKVHSDRYIDVEYFIDDGCVWYNLNISRFGYIRFLPPSPNVLIENAGDIIKVKALHVHLNSDLIISHLKVIYDLLQIVGDRVDVNITVPNHSVLWALTNYNGTDTRFLRAHKVIEDRLGCTGFTLNNAYSRNASYKQKLWDDED